MAKLCWLGQMGLMIKSRETTICIDYFATPTKERRVAPPLATEELRGVDAFLGTHNHLDHIDHEAWKIWAKAYPEAKFIFPRAHQRQGCFSVYPRLHRQHDLSGDAPVLPRQAIE